ncbi:hypothetical protein VTJ49DRAFT_6807 [Mycothermus thermophilus]|uniref:Uncharacterized protein n=1 Tax=Humicola insolens TaxID=85995 RepID=A0ABR3VJT2_HUMIN
MTQAIPARHVVRGFNVRAPVTSTDENSDFCSTLNRGNEPGGKKKRRPRRAKKASAVAGDARARSSPALKPVLSLQDGGSGISRLRKQLEGLSVATESVVEPTPTAAPAAAWAYASTDASTVASTVASTAASSVAPTVASSRTASLTCCDGFRSPVAPGETITTCTQTPKDRSDSTASSHDDTASVDSTQHLEIVVNEFTSDANNLSSADGSLQPRSKMTADDFEPIRCLGKGAFGTVILVKQRSTGRLFAQKQFKKASLVVNQGLIDQTKTERQILESVNQHPFVVKLYYAFQDREKLYLILEYGQGGELFHHLREEHMLSEEKAAFYMAEVVLALDYLHNKLGVVYRDLKPENCLLDAEGHLLLTDFGLSKVAVDSEECTSFLGTPDYMAPEIIQGKKYGKAVDWWALGVLGYDLMTGESPFHGANTAKTQENIVKKKVQMPFFLGPDAKDLLTRLLRKEPHKRLGANMPKDLETIKKHRFFRKIDWKKLERRELEPPIQPIITDPELAENFDAVFTNAPLSQVASRRPALTSHGSSTTHHSSSSSSSSPSEELTTSSSDSDESSVSPGSSGSTEESREDPFRGFSFVAPSALLEHFEDDGSG